MNSLLFLRDLRQGFPRDSIKLSGGHDKGLYLFLLVAPCPDGMASKSSLGCHQVISIDFANNSTRSPLLLLSPRLHARDRVETMLETSKNTETQPKDFAKASTWIPAHYLGEFHQINVSIASHQQGEAFLQRLGVVFSRLGRG